VWASQIRRVEASPYRRERLELDDGDFLDLDWLRADPSARSKRAVVVSHGLEGDAHRPYVRGMARAFARCGVDALAWNYRGCSGEPNRLVRAYHSGATDDLDAVVSHVLGTGYERVDLVGFSLGGNLSLKYAAEQAEQMDERVGRVAVFSVPVDLAASSKYLARPAARPYMRYFLRKLVRKVESKADLFPDQIDLDGLRAMRTFGEFDDRYTAPWHGFESAEHYWAEASALPVLREIRRPALLVNASDDPFLPPSCYPVYEAGMNPNVRLELPKWGGHVGFVEFRRDGLYWSERRALAFVLEER
jgi:predicted alpha/beta-fold hydrolase